MKALIAYDGSAGGDTALEDLSRAGLSDVEAKVLTVADVWLPSTAETGVQMTTNGAGANVHAQAQAALEHARRLARVAADRLRAQFPGWRIENEAAAESPAWSIILHAERWHADLVVVGSHDRSLVGRVLLGSVALRVLDELRCSVSIARPRARSTGPIRVLVGADGSPGAEAALSAVLGRRWPPDAELRVVTAANWQLHQAFPASALTTSPEWAGAIAEKARIALASAGLRVEKVVREGDAKRVLVDEAESWGADCVFVGARGLTRAERLLLGSVASAVALRAPCSVEVVRTPTTRA